MNFDLNVFSYVFSWTITLGPYLLIYLFSRSIYQLYWNSTRKQGGGMVVLITGASSGIGEAIARVFYLSGSKVILASRRVSELERVKRELLALETNTGEAYDPVVLQLDMEDLDGIPSKMKEAWNIHGRIDVLIANAGVYARGTVAETSLDVYKKIMNINYFGQIVMIKALLNKMILSRSGHIVGMSSLSSYVSLPKRSVYSSSKFAFRSFLESLRAEVSSQNIKVTVVNPSYVRTPIALNSLTATGEVSGVSNVRIETGLDPSVVAQDTFDAVIMEQDDILVAPLSHKLFVWCRTLMPTVHFKILNRIALTED